MQLTRIACLGTVRTDYDAPLSINIGSSRGRWNGGGAKPRIMRCPEARGEPDGQPAHTRLCLTGRRPPTCKPTNAEIIAPDGFSAGTAGGAPIALPRLRSCVDLVERQPFELAGGAPILEDLDEGEHTAAERAVQDQLA